MPSAAVVFDSHVPVGVDLALFPGVNLITGSRHFRDEFGPPTALETDLLILASAIFACDLAFKRGQREEITRQIALTVPVVHRSLFESVRDQLTFALYRLSHDAWDLRFTQREGVPETPRKRTGGATGKVLLFSGGLDSLAAAVRYGGAGEAIHLASHVTANRVVSGAQEDLTTYLDKEFPGVFTRSAFRVSGISRPAKGFPFPSDRDREETQRTRSFLFLVLAALVARRRSLRDVVMIAENGQLAIHLPLTAGRISAFSTHTAHPEFVHVMGGLLSQILDYEIRIENPFLYMTKGEVVEPVVTAHRPALELAVSCWKASRVTGAERHCGFCIPCLVRRIAVEVHGVHLAEYKRDLLAEDVAAAPADDEGKRNLVELAEFARIFESGLPQVELEDTFAELVNPHIDAERAVAMYRRFAAEARAVFDRYPNVRDLLR